MLRDESRFPSDVSARLSSAPLRVALPGGSAIPSSNFGPVRPPSLRFSITLATQVVSQCSKYYHANVLPC